ncbi:MAG: hypothetical protein QNK37_33725 [Acidobacteriota bacterium]|nr:hypothetical protein [Acidobacteriota bacterium]
MAKRKGLKEQLELVARLDPDTMTTAEYTEVMGFLNGHPRLASRALKLLVATPRGLPEDLLAELFETHRRGGKETDPGCEIKQAIIDALARMESERAEIFLAAARCRQLESAYGPPEDTASELRGLAFGALVSLGYRDIHYLAVDLLMDKEADTRQLVVQAMGHLGSEAAEVLLRFKLLNGDPESGVIAECFASLMRINPDKSLDLAQAYLDDPDPELAESAALAIGESRHPKAFEVLRRYWDANHVPAKQDRLILPLALMRSRESQDFLLGLLEEGNKRHARSVFQALRIYRADENIRNRIEAILKKQRNSQWQDYYRSYFGV